MHAIDTTQLLGYLSAASAAAALALAIAHKVTVALHAINASVITLADSIRTAAPGTKAATVAATVEAGVAKEDAIVTTIDNELTTVAGVAGLKGSI